MFKPFHDMFSDTAFGESGHFCHFPILFLMDVTLFHDSTCLLRKLLNQFHDGSDALFAFLILFVVPFTQHVKIGIAVTFLQTAAADVVDAETLYMRVHISNSCGGVERFNAFPHIVERVVHNILASFFVGNKAEGIVIETREVFFEEFLEFLS